LGACAETPGSFIDNWKPNNTKPALTLIDTLLTELKRLDDKMILTEVHLLESRVYRGTGNMAKAEGEKPPSFRSFSPNFLRLPLTNSHTGRTHLLSNGCQLHLLPTCLSSPHSTSKGGILHAEDKDYTTGITRTSLRAFENLSTQGDDQDGKALGPRSKYMLLL